MVSDIMNVAEEIRELEKKIAYYELSQPQEEKGKNSIAEFMIEYGKKMFFKQFERQMEWRSEFTVRYDENGYSKSFDEFYNNFFKLMISNIRESEFDFPKNATIEQLREYPRAEAEIYFANKMKEAQLAYARSKKGEE